MTTHHLDDNLHAVYLNIFRIQICEKTENEERERESISMVTV